MTLVVLAGIPYASIRYVGWPLPTSVPDRNTLYDWIEHPFTPARFWAIMSIVGWILWAAMLYVLADELFARFGRFRRLPRLRLASPIQGIAAGIVGASAVAAPVAAHAAPAAPEPQAPDIDPGTQATERLAPAVLRSVEANPTYVVEHGDWLSAVAARFLGDPDAYPSIQALNPDLEARDTRFPNHIEPGWRIQLPADAYDRGIRLHAAGTLQNPATFNVSPPTPQPSTVDLTSTDRPGGAPAEPPRPPSVMPSQTVPAQAPEGADDIDSDGGGHPDVIVGYTHGAMAGGGLLAAMLFAMLMAERRRQRGLYGAGQEPPRPRSGRAERELRAAQEPIDVARLDAALRSLSRALAGSTRVPDIVGVRLVGGDVQVLLDQPDDEPPSPWLDEGTQWALPAYLEPPPETSPTTILPALAAIGSRAGRHLYIDLERLGTLSIGGHPYSARDLLRYMACELACNTWSDQATIILAGFGDEADAITEIGPKRIVVAESADAAVATVRTELTQRAKAGTTQPAMLLLVASADAATRTTLADLHLALAAVGRCGIAIVATVPDGAPIGTAMLTVADTGALRADLPGLRLTTDAASLPVDMLEPLADLFRVARLAPATALAPAADLPPWDDTIDPDLGVQAVFAPSTPDRPPTTPSPSAVVAPLVAVTPNAGIAANLAMHDQLDTDLAAWHDPANTRPRIGILGPIDVRMPGVLNDSRRRLYSEMLVYLLTRPARSADRASIEDALWYGKPAGDTTVRKVMYKLRQWLGPRLDGREWIRGSNDPGGTYQLEDGVLLDWHLLLGLHQRGTDRGPGGVADLRGALELVRGVPLADRRDKGHYRRPYTWIGDSDIAPDRVIAVIAGIAHQLARHHLAVDDPDTAIWAIDRAWLADPHRGFDDLWHDRMHAEHQAGNTIALQQLVREYLDANDAEVPEDLPTAIYNRIRALLPAAGH